MKNFFIMMAIKTIMGMLTPELMLKLITNLRVKIEQRIKETGTTVDDVLYASLTKGSADFKLIADSVLDFCEEFVLGTASPLDDAAVLPVCNTLRAALDIPDND